MSTVVADTGDIEAIKKYKPVDATTNPSLVLKAASMPQYRQLIDDALEWAINQSDNYTQQTIDASDMLAILIGKEISSLIPGRISTEVDARFSFDTKATIKKAHRLIELYTNVGIDKSRVLIKIASTWEGIRAAEQLEKEGINCNLTLLFSFAQARACAEAKVFLVSPFVGRIFDWYKAKTGNDGYPALEDPGVISVTKIYNYYKEYGHKTIVMGASFRNAGQVKALAGCDRLTISPQLLEELANCDYVLLKQLVDNGQKSKPQAPLSESEFRWLMNEDAMAIEKLAEGIRNFTVDQEKLESQLQALLTKKRAHYI